MKYLDESNEKNEDGLVIAEGLDMNEYPKDIDGWESHGVTDARGAVAFCIWAVCTEGIQFPPFSDEAAKFTLNNLGYEHFDTINALYNHSRAALREEGALIEEVTMRLFSGMRGGYEPRLTVMTFDEPFFEDEVAMDSYYHHVLTQIVHETLVVWAESGHPAVSVESDSVHLALNVELMAEMEPDFMGVLAYVNNYTQDTDSPIVADSVMRTEEGVEVTGDYAEQERDRIMDKVNELISDNANDFQRLQSEAEYMGVDIDGDDNDDDPFGGEEE